MQMQKSLWIATLCTLTLLALRKQFTWLVFKPDWPGQFLESHRHESQLWIACVYHSVVIDFSALKEQSLKVTEICPDRSVISTAAATRPCVAVDNFVVGVEADDSPNLYHQLVYNLVNVAHSGFMLLDVRTVSELNIWFPGLSPSLKIIELFQYPTSESGCARISKLVVSKGHQFFVNEVSMSSVETIALATVYSGIRSVVFEKLNLRQACSTPKNAVQPLSIRYLHRPGVLYNATHAKCGTHRGVLNPQDVLYFLRRPFTTVAMLQFDASQSLSEQILSVCNADMVVSMHGQGLWIIVFMRPTAVVVEMFPYGFAAADYRNLAWYSSVRYFHWQNTNASLSVSHCIDVRMSAHFLCRGEMTTVSSSLNLVIDVVLYELFVTPPRTWWDCPDYGIGPRLRHPSVNVKCRHCHVRGVCTSVRTDADTIMRKNSIGASS